MAAAKAFDKILDCVKSSNLNFCIQLSPFSANISLKKTLVKNKAGFYLIPADDPILRTHEIENIELRKKVSDLEHVIADLKSRLGESETKCDHAYQTIHRLEGEARIKQENIDTKESDLNKALADHLEKKTIEISSLEEEKKQLQAKIHDIQISLKNSISAATRLKKEVIDNRNNHEKELRLTTKNLKSEIKSWRKDLGFERSEKIKTERKLATVMNDLSKPKPSVSCQTVQSLDTPYLVTDVLPPIFGSQLCRTTKPIHNRNFSRSLPNMSTISWVRITEEDILEDEAAQALNDQYDRHIQEFYKDAKQKAEAVREVFDEKYLEVLFEEKS